MIRQPADGKCHHNNYHHFYNLERKKEKGQFWKTLKSLNIFVAVAYCKSYFSANIVKYIACPRISIKKVGGKLGTAALDKSQESYADVTIPSLSNPSEWVTLTQTETHIY